MCAVRVQYKLGCVDVCVCVCVWVHKCVGLGVWMHECVHVLVHCMSRACIAYVHVSVHVYVYMHCVCVCVQYIHTIQEAANIT